MYLMSKVTVVNEVKVGDILQNALPCIQIEITASWNS